MFESSVISLGNETISANGLAVLTFESSVISLGNETALRPAKLLITFESSVISLGNETPDIITSCQDSLRVVSFR